MDKKENFLNLSDPVVSNYPFIYFTCDRDPTSSEPVYSDITDFIFFWINTVSKDFFICTDNTTDDMQWEKITTSRNVEEQIQNSLDNMGWEINTSRSASSITPPSFNVSRQPSTTNDVFVSSNILFSAVLSLNSQVNIEISTNNSTWVTYGKAKQQISLAANIIQQIYALVPAGSYYRFTTSGSGGSIDSILETKM